SASRSPGVAPASASTASTCGASCSAWARGSTCRRRASGWIFPLASSFTSATAVAAVAVSSASTNTSAPYRHLQVGQAGRPVPASADQLHLSGLVLPGGVLAAGRTVDPHQQVRVGQLLHHPLAPL